MTCFFGVAANDSILRIEKNATFFHHFDLVWIVVGDVGHGLIEIEICFSRVTSLRLSVVCW